MVTQDAETKVKKKMHYITIASFIAIPFVTFIVFKIIVFIQKALYQRPNEILLSNGFLLFYSFFFSLLFCLLTGIRIIKRSSGLWQQAITTSVFSKQSMESMLKIFTIMMVFPLIMLYLLINSYLVVTDSYLTISEPGLTSLRHTYSYGDIRKIDPFYLRLKNGEKYSIKNILGLREILPEINKGVK